ncbi:Hypothetical protein CINCED_3A000127 [Cinara cedri]|uniref:Uncharacterized protein n=1 Tax=Cinara cedri TaxID=506608 RepID=A0A5E4N4D4_9HEMI|nr:Hypothetical protein CINCED_3A000127 [Cinara cedri]
MNSEATSTNPPIKHYETSFKWTPTMKMYLLSHTSNKDLLPFGTYISSFGWSTLTFI